MLNPSCECNVKDSMFSAALPINAPFFNVFDSLRELKYGSKIFLKACDFPVPGLPKIPIKVPFDSGLLSFRLCTSSSSALTRKCLFRRCVCRNNKIDKSCGLTSTVFRI